MGFLRPYTMGMWRLQEKGIPEHIAGKVDYASGAGKA